MSWDASLTVNVDGNRVEVGDDFNYTHNTNRMIANVLEEAGKDVGSAWWNDLRKEKGDYWCTVLNGLNGKEGEKLLSIIITGLEADPQRFEAMNPDNGWGNYSGMLNVLKHMRQQSIKYPSAVWSIS